MSRNIYRDLFIGLDSKFEVLSGEMITSINFDNAATTPVFRCVMEKILQTSETYGSIGRGLGHKSEYTTKLYEEAREYILKHFNAPKERYTAIFVANTTEGINKVSNVLAGNKEDIVLTTRMEHHSNDLPWRKNFDVDYVDVDSLGRIKIEDIEEKLINAKGKIKYVAITGASNVTGYVNDICKISNLVHKYNAKIIIDGAQLVPHKKINCTIQEIDFLVFAGHKMYAPFGGAVVIGLKDVFNNANPDMPGGGTVEAVMDSSTVWLNTPERNEGGTPNFFGAIALAESLKEFNRIGYENIEKNEKNLLKLMISELKSIPKVTLYGDNENIEDKLGIIVFNIDGVYCAEVAKTLAKMRAIAVRQGAFCAHPYVNRLLNLTEEESTEYLLNKNMKMPGMIRASLGIYNEEDEVEIFINTIKMISKL